MSLAEGNFLKCPTGRTDVQLKILWTKDTVIVALQENTHLF